jgi:hypothetical protein
MFWIEIGLAVLLSGMGGKGRQVVSRGFKMAQIAMFGFFLLFICIRRICGLFNAYSSIDRLYCLLLSCEFHFVKGEGRRQFLRLLSGIKAAGVARC